MDIAFINSPLQDYGKKAKKEYYTTPPMGLGYLAVTAQNLGHNVRLIDSEARGLSLEQSVNETISESPDLVGINLITPTFNLSKQIIQGIKQKNPKIKIITGGTHATINPEQSLKQIPETDILVRGEGELTLTGLLKNNLNSDGIKGTSYFSGNKIIHNPEREKIEDLDSLPFVDRSFFINDPSQENENLKSVIMGSRGCPYTCSFCSAPLTSGRKIRTRSIENIVDEMELLKQKYGINSVHFLDNDFIYNKDRVLHLAEELQRRDLGIKWRALARIDITSKFGKGFLQKIKQAGCYQLVFGIESGSQRILDSIKKGTTPEQARKAIQYCQDVGIKTKAYYMFGFPTETLDEMNQTLNLAKELNTDTACFVLVKAYPGTEMYSSLVQQYGDKQLQIYNHLQEQVPLNIPNQNFDKYHIGNSLSFCKASPKELNNMLRKAYNMYYSSGGKRKLDLA
ncbi:radical SAM protein [Candidatus Pacearchaeota archaeon]|nr:radical SAM protein [Candidatus Pacearchaeota archaeon]